MRRKDASSMKPYTVRLACCRAATARACSQSGADASTLPRQLIRVSQRIRSVLL